jgi:hypothetical protein
MLIAERGGDLMMARIAVMRAPSCLQERGFLSTSWFVLSPVSPPAPTVLLRTSFEK